MEYYNGNLFRKKKLPVLDVTCIAPAISIPEAAYQRKGLMWCSSIGSNEIEAAEQKVAYDAYYVEHHTLFMDIRILFQTIAAVLTGKGFAEGGELQHHGEQGEDDSEIE